MIQLPVREPVRVLMHLNGGYTKVSLERYEGVGLANGGIEWDIPTSVIPPHLRGIGARFLLVTENVRAGASDTAEELRAAVAAFRAAMRVEELSDGTGGLPRGGRVAL